MQGKFPALATENDYYMALAYAVRDRMLQRWISTAASYTKHGSRTVAYLSAEFLLGPHLGNNLINLGILEPVKQCMTELGMNFDELLHQEEEPGLGSGGLGRLAACFIDSLATLEVPALGYGIRYEFGIFHQEIIDGWQIEKTDRWLRFGNPWELVRPEWAVSVKFGGTTEQYSTSTSGSACAGYRTKSSMACRTTPSFSAITATPRIRCACGAPRRRNPSTSPASTAAIITAPSTKKSSRRTSARCSIRTTSSCAARSCASNSNISSSLARCRTCSASCARRSCRSPSSTRSSRCS